MCPKGQALLALENVVMWPPLADRKGRLTYALMWLSTVGLVLFSWHYPLGEENIDVHV